MARKLELVNGCAPGDADGVPLLFGGVDVDKGFVVLLPGFFVLALREELVAGLLFFRCVKDALGGSGY